MKQYIGSQSYWIKFKRKLSYTSIWLKNYWKWQWDATKTRNNWNQQKKKKSLIMPLWIYVFGIGMGYEYTKSSIHCEFLYILLSTSEIQTFGKQCFIIFSGEWGPVIKSQSDTRNECEEQEINDKEKRNEWIIENRYKWKYIHWGFLQLKQNDSWARQWFNCKLYTFPLYLL